MYLPYFIRNVFFFCLAILSFKSYCLYPSSVVAVNENGTRLVEVDTTTFVPASRSFNIELNEENAHHSIARIWNEAVLEAIRNDFARPTVHARNLYHLSVVMYDTWAIYDDPEFTYLIGKDLHGFSSTLESFTPSESIEISRHKAISYAAYRLLNYRFQNAPDYAASKVIFDDIMATSGYDTSFTSVNYQSGDARALGNYIAQTMISYGNADGARELSGYDNAFYQPVNDPLNPTMTGNPTITNPNRWQPLDLDTYIDQSGNVISGDVINFLSPEWGSVNPFALTDEDKTVYIKDSQEYVVYHDPGDPPYLNTTEEDQNSEYYKWGFSLVSIWSSHLDPTDGVMMDISPNSIGNLTINDIPTDLADYSSFYDLEEGGTNSPGYTVNPVTGMPYQTQMVPRGDYARVLAEFWADGPDSETPPGHWFTILNYVNDQPSLVKKFGGQGDIISDLEWDVKAYFILGGAMHDAAITAWGIKGYYDYIRPVSAIRYMVDQGQSSDPNLPNYSIAGIPLKPGYVELVEAGDPLAGSSNQHVGKIKLYTWRGPDYISDPDTDDAGVGWILGENWWPYQRPSFVTPPFAGYVSGHSTYSRAAAEVLTLITGDEYFPGGMGEFIAPQNEFLVFEEGPSVDVTLQWAKYRDASDQCSLSRIWGGIHPPADDLPGRHAGYEIGQDAFNFAVSIFNSSLDVVDFEINDYRIYPNPVLNYEVNITKTNDQDEIKVYDLQGRPIKLLERTYDASRNINSIKLPLELSTGLYIMKVNNTSKILSLKRH
ncbi:MAG: T9SS type A sorting domain-containing protein [Flavobacteriaceae bacterium]|nr:T9SS type A sorting domain-containing protein [Flavobacteriaceae bacterium]